MCRTNIYLDDERCAALDAVAAQQGTSRAAVVRRLIDEGLADHRPSIDEDIAGFDASVGGAPGIVALGRGDDDRARHLRRVAAHPS